MRVVDLAETFGRFTDAWSPKIVGDVNDMHVKVVKLRGEFVWHHHDAEDELFLVVAGRLRMQLRDGDREVGPGQLIIVPRGVEHCPKARGPRGPARAEGHAQHGRREERAHRGDSREALGDSSIRAPSHLSAA